MKYTIQVYVGDSYTVILCKPMKAPMISHYYSIRVLMNASLGNTSFSQNVHDLRKRGRYILGPDDAVSLVLWWPKKKLKYTVSWFNESSSMIM